jgi:TrmH family RNA methyltransferase
MISKGTTRFIKSLQLKKYRNKAQSFLVEGAKSVLELLISDFEVTHIIGVESFFRDNAALLAKFDSVREIVSEKEINQLSALKNNNTVLAAARYRTNDLLSINDDQFYLALDRIRDPGNLGTIIRTADWYGIDSLLCSTDCADFFNPKTIQSSMGSFTRVKAFYIDLRECLIGKRVYGTSTYGENIHHIEFAASGIVLIGNEAQGVSSNLESLVTQWITIPKFGSAESLNAAMAAAVICDNIRRRG